MTVREGDKVLTLYGPGIVTRCWCAWVGVFTVSGRYVKARPADLRKTP